MQQNDQDMNNASQKGGMLSESEIDLIRDYWQGTLDETQRDEVKRRMAKDLVFSEAVEDHRLLMKVVTEQGETALRTWVSAWREEVPDSTPLQVTKSPSPVNYWRWAAVLLTLFWAGHAWWQRQEMTAFSQEIHVLKQKLEQSQKDYARIVLQDSLLRDSINRLQLLLEHPKSMPQPAVWRLNEEERKSIFAAFLSEERDGLAPAGSRNNDWENEFWSDTPNYEQTLNLILQKEKKAEGGELAINEYYIAGCICLLQGNPCPSNEAIRLLEKGKKVARNARDWDKMLLIAYLKASRYQEARALELPPKDWPGGAKAILSPK